MRNRYAFTFFLHYAISNSLKISEFLSIISRTGKCSFKYKSPCAMELSSPILVPRIHDIEHFIHITISNQKN